MVRMELLNYIRPEERLTSLQKVYNRLKTRIPKGTARREIENALKAAGRIPVSLVASSPEFETLFKRLKIKFIGYDDPDAD